MKQVFSLSKEEKMSEKVFMIRTILSVAAMLFCICLLCSGTLAYFNDTISVQGTTITAANFDLVIKDGQNQPVTESYTCPLVSEDLHSFTLTASGTAETGYCQITVKTGDQTETYYTTQIYQTAGEDGTRPTSITLQIKAASGSTVTFTPRWGTSVNYAVNQESLYADGDVIAHSFTPFVTYTLADGITLEEIAAHYGVSSDDILTYNGLTGLPAVGSELKIPGRNVTTAPATLEEESQTPEEESEILEEESQTPEEESVTPEEESEILEEESATPEEESQAPEEESQTPEEESQTPEEESEILEEESETPEEESKISEEESETPVA